MLLCVAISLYVKECVRRVRKTQKINVYVNVRECLCMLRLLIGVEGDDMLQFASVSPPDLLQFASVSFFLLN